jgi:glycosyltransferase involved in cell wall biosynthesis
VRRPLRLAYLVSHPIQYQVPLLRRIAKEPDIDLTVFYGSDFSVRGYKDEGFGVEMKWDVPLLDGYEHEFLPVLRDNGTQKVLSPMNYGIFSRLAGRGGRPKFDVLWLHGYGTFNSVMAMIAAKALGIPVLLRAESWLGDRERSSLKLEMKHAFFHALGGMIEGVLPIGSLNDRYWEYYLRHNVTRFLMPYAVDNDFFQRRAMEAAARQNELRSELGIEPGRPVILFASKLQERKNADHLVEAYKRLLSRSASRPYLVIVGDGEMRSALEQQTEGLADVRFCGFRNQTELPRFFNLATVFVLPSRHEPWGLIVNEVMNAARPVIVSSDVGSHPDLITNGVEGFVYPVGDVAALEEALHEVIETPGLAERMGQAALERVNRWSFQEDVAALRGALAAVAGDSSF